MDSLWFVASLWVLVGLVAALLAIWVGRSLRDEFLKASKEIRHRRGALRLVRSRSATVARRSAARVEPARLFAVGVVGTSSDQ